MVTHDQYFAEWVGVTTYWRAGNGTVIEIGGPRGNELQRCIHRR